MDSVFLSDSGLSLTHVLKSIDLRFQNECNSLLSSKPTVLPPSFSSRATACSKRDQPARILRIPARRCRIPAKPGLRCVSSEEGKGLRRSLAPSERELASKVTEGENPIDLCTTQFLQLSLMAAKTSLACAHSCRAQATARQLLAAGTARKKRHSINYRMSFIESGGDLPSRAVASQVPSAC